MLWGLLRLGLLLAAVAGCLAAVVGLYVGWRGDIRPETLLEGANPNLSTTEQLYLQAYLATHAEALAQPAGSGTSAVTFEIAPGETADVIADNLATAGLLADTELFLNYTRYHGLDASLEAGSFVVEPGVTVPELATMLTDAAAEEFDLRFLEGWRLEEMAHYLEVTTPANIDAGTFLAVVQRQGAFDLSRYNFLAGLPPDATLEGYLFPDTYRVPRDADTAYLVDLMLQTFGRRVTPAMRQSYGAQGLSLHEAVTLASIVEREAVLAEERPLIAGVFYNRLQQEIPLAADPTIQYALGYQATSDSWWKSPLSLADLELDSPYNTYLVTGLPPAPIANPGLASLQAVAEPATTDFLFFVVDCTAATGGKHAFSTTYEEHVVNVERCR